MVGRVWCARSRIVRGILAWLTLALVSTCVVASVGAAGRLRGKLGGLPTPTEPQALQIVPSIVTFDGVPSGERYTQTVRLTNVTSATLGVTRISASGPDFVISGATLPVTLEPHGCLTFTVEYQPKSAGRVRAEIQVQTNLEGAAAVVELSGSATASERELTASDGRLDFDEITAGNGAIKPLILRNGGNAKITISKMVVFGEAFSVSGASAVGLTAGQTTNLEVRFDPKNVGTSTGTLSIFSNAPDSPLQIPLSGTSLLASPQAISLKWNESQEGASGYFVYRSSQNGGPYRKLQDTALSSTEFTDTGLAAGRTYYYVITAVDGNDVESNYSDQIVMTVPET
jgi:ASPM-SPD-2-Hydin domain-containing protein/centrosomal CEP192-like protein